MANYCYNYVSGSGSEENLTRLQKIVDILSEGKNNYVSCWAEVYPKFFPQENTEQEEDEQKSYGDVYDNWGSKWFEAEFDIDAKDGSFTICGDSAWSPVMIFFAKLAKEYKLTLDGYYDEPGMDFAGTFCISEDGGLEEVQMSSRQFRMQDNPDGFWEDIMSSIEDGFFETFEDVLSEFDPEYWGELSEGEKVDLAEAFKAYKDRVREELDGEETN